MRQTYKLADLRIAATRSRPRPLNATDAVLIDKRSRADRPAPITDQRCTTPGCLAREAGAVHPAVVVEVLQETLVGSVHRRRESRSPGFHYGQERRAGPCQDRRGESARTLGPSQGCRQPSRRSGCRTASAGRASGGDGADLWSQSPGTRPSMAATSPAGTVGENR